MGIGAQAGGDEGVKKTTAVSQHLILPGSLLEASSGIEPEYADLQSAA